MKNPAGGLLVGVVLGALAGLVFGHLAVCVGLGTSLGIVFGALWGRTNTDPNRPK
jgi:hypothetical protein